MNSLRAGPGLSILIVFRRAQLILLEDTTWVRHLKDRGRGMMSRLWLERARARRPPFLRLSYVKGRQTIETLMYCTCRVIAPKTQRKNSSARCSLETSGFLDEEWRANGVTSSAHHGEAFSNSPPNLTDPSVSRSPPVNWATMCYQASPGTWRARNAKQRGIPQRWRQCTRNSRVRKGGVCRKWVR